MSRGHRARSALGRAGLVVLVVAVLPAAASAATLRSVGALRVAGSTDRRWNDENLNALKAIPGRAFQVIRRGPQTSPC